MKTKSACAVPLLSSVLEQIEFLFRVPEYRRLCFLQGIQFEKDTASGCNWRAMVKVVCVVWLMLSAVPAGAQWLTLRTPGLPRTPDGKVNLSAPAPRTAEGKPDLTGYWTPAGGQGDLSGLETLRVDPADIKPWARDVMRERGQDFFKSRPEFQCRPSGPEAESLEGEQRILQTPGMIAVLNPNLTYRQIFLDGRSLEKDPQPMWMGYSVGRWDGDTLVVESNGFNDRTWLNNVGLPHTTKLRMTERYRRPDLGHLKVDVTYVDPDTFNKPLQFSLDMRLVTDTEMLEEVCESKMEFWTGNISDLQKSAVKVSEDVMRKYVGYYEGYWRDNLRKVTVSLEKGALHVTGLLLPESVPLIPASDTIFTSEEGVSYKFVMDASGKVVQVEEIHRGGNYILKRQN